MSTLITDRQGYYFQICHAKLGPQYSVNMTSAQLDMDINPQRLKRVIVASPDMYPQTYPLDSYPRAL